MKKCGRETGGAKVSELGICPASTDSKYNGMNHGVNAGRMCWCVAGTFCGGHAQGTFAQKYNTCMSCEVFRMVKEEERANFKIMP